MLRGSPVDAVTVPVTWTVVGRVMVKSLGPLAVVVTLILVVTPTVGWAVIRRSPVVAGMVTSVPDWLLPKLLWRKSSVGWTSGAACPGIGMSTLTDAETGLPLASRTWTVIGVTGRVRSRVVLPVMVKSLAARLKPGTLEPPMFMWLNVTK